MAWKQLALAGLVAASVSATAVSALAQGLLIPQRAEAPVSPTTPTGLLNSQTTGTNPLTGLPCSGQGSLAVSGVGGLGDTASPPPGGDPSTPAAQQLPSLTSVFGTGSSAGAC